MSTIDHFFEEHRPHLHSAASRILGSAVDADDAVQEAWLRLRRTDPETIDNPAGWLSTVLARVSVDMLRARTRRPRPGLVGDEVPPAGQEPTQEGPETEILRLDSVAGALGVVMDTLSPDQRLAFVLHESFAVPFDTIAGMLSCSPEAARQHASRARRRMRGRARAGSPRTARHRRIVSAFLAAARNGDVRELVAELQPWVGCEPDASAEEGCEDGSFGAGVGWYTGCRDGSLERAGTVHGGGARCSGCASRRDEPRPRPSRGDGSRSR